VVELATQAPTRSYRLSISYAALHGEREMDLLAGSSPAHQKQANAVRRVPVCRVEEMSAIVVQGQVKLAALREEGTLCHGIFKLFLESETTTPGAGTSGGKEDGGKLPRKSVFTLIDLLPFPTAAAAAAAGHQQDPGLVALEALVSALDAARGEELLGPVGTSGTTAPGARNPGSSCYEASRLTRLLQTPLGGSSKTAVLCCVSPAALPALSGSGEQPADPAGGSDAATLYTLDFGRKCRKFQNSPELHETSTNTVPAPLYHAAAWNLAQSRLMGEHAARGSRQRIEELIRIIKDGKGSRNQLRSQLQSTQRVAQVHALRSLSEGARFNAMFGGLLRGFSSWAMQAIRCGRETSTMSDYYHIWTSNPRFYSLGDPMREGDVYTPPNPS